MRRTALLTIAATLLVVACTPTDSTTTTSTGGTALPSSSSTTTTEAPDGFGGVVRIGVEIVPTVLNPFSTQATFETIMVGNAVWATVYDFDPVTGERVADAVTELPSRTAGGIVDNGDGTITVQYQVARRATWSDGTPMTGADVAFTAEAMRDLASVGNPAVDPIMASVVEVDSVEQVAWITYSEASLVVEDALWIILPAHAVADTDITATDGTDWPAGGPFMIGGGISSLVRNPNYWKTDASDRQLPYADAVEFVEMFDGGVDGFTNREIDVMAFNPTAETRSTIEGKSTEGAEALVGASPIIEHLTFNILETRLEGNERSFNSDLDYRTAIAHAIDRQAVVDESAVPWLPAYGLLDPGGDAWSRYSFSSAEARSLVSGLDAAQSPVAMLSTTVNDDERPSVAEALRSSFAPIGVEYETDLEDSLLFFQTTLPEGTFDLGMWAWLNDGSYRETLAMLLRFDPAGGNGSFSGWGAEGSEAAVRFTELVGTASTTVSAEEFRTAVSEAEDILASELPIIPLFRRTTLTGVWVDTVMGVVAPESNDNLTWNIELWQVAGE